MLLHLLQLLLGLLSLLLEFMALVIELVLHILVCISSFGFESSGQENLSRRLVFVHDCEPIFDSAVDHETGHLDLDETNGVAGCEVLVPASQSHLIRGRLYFEGELVVPLGLLAATVVNLCLVLLVLKSNGDIGAHGPKHFSVSGELAFFDA